MSVKGGGDQADEEIKLLSCLVIVTKDHLNEDLLTFFCFVGPSASTHTQTSQQVIQSRRKYNRD